MSFCVTSIIWDPDERNSESHRYNTVHFCNYILHDTDTCRTIVRLQTRTNTAELACMWAMGCSIYVYIKSTMISYRHYIPWYQGPWGQHGAHLGPTGPRWTPCWPQELCYLGRRSFRIADFCEENALVLRDKLLWQWDKIWNFSSRNCFRKYAACKITATMSGLDESK